MSTTKRYIVRSGLYDLERHGKAYILVKSNARQITMRWRGGLLHITVPLNADYDAVLQALDKHHDRLEQWRPEALYHIGQVIDIEQYRVEIRSQSRDPRQIFMSFRPPRGLIEVGDAWDLDSHDAEVNISKMLCSIARNVAHGILMPMAQEVAARVGKHPLGWSISNGHRTLGHCSASGMIALSYVLVFYPRHLREYVVCHELAHLTEMNHSPRFHELCNAYCQGREAEYLAEMKRYVPPIVK